MNCSGRGNATEHKSLFFQHSELILEKQGDFLENCFLKKMEEKCSSLPSDDG